MRQFSGLPIHRQEYWINRYKNHFPKSKIVPPNEITGFWQILFPFPHGEEDILASLDEECNSEWMDYHKYYKP